MGTRHAVKKVVIGRYTGEASGDDIRYNIVKLLAEEQERGILSDAGKRKQQHRDLCKGKQG